MRNFTTEMEDGLSQQKVQPALLAWFEFDSSPIGMWTGIGEITWNSMTFLGGGDFIGVSPIEETQDIIAKGLVLSLNGIDSSNIALALTEDIKNRPVRLYFGLFVDFQLVDDPYRIFSGLMDTVEFTDDGATGTIRLSVENILYIGQRAKVSRYTDEDQRKKYPDDTGLSRINNLQDKEVVW